MSVAWVCVHGLCPKFAAVLYQDSMLYPHKEIIRGHFGVPGYIVVLKSHMQRWNYRTVIPVPDPEHPRRRSVERDQYTV